MNLMFKYIRYSFNKLTWYKTNRNYLRHVQRGAQFQVRQITWGLRKVPTMIQVLFQCSRFIPKKP